VSFNTATGVLSGTPAAGTGGTYPITFAAANGVAPDASQAFTLTVHQAPAITSANATTFTEGSAGSFTVTATGTPTPTTFGESGALPNGVTFNTTTHVLAGTPAAGTAGVYPITFTATNGVLPDATQSFTLTVQSSGVAPTITSANATTFTEGTAGSFTLTATGTPTPTLSESGTLPSGVTFDTGTGVLSGTPDAGTAGTYPITFTAANGVAPDATQSFTLTVAPAQTGVAPTITSANATTFTEGSAGSFTVTATGTPTPTLSESGALPSGVTFDTGTGVISGTPDAGTAGVYPITFTATNGVAPDASQTFTLTVQPASTGGGGADLKVTINDIGSFRSRFFVAYVLTVKNVGDAATSGPIVLTDSTTSGVSFVTALGDWPRNCSVHSATVMCTRSQSLRPGRSWTIIVIAKVTGQPGAVVTNTTTVTPLDDTPGNNTATDQSTVLGRPRPTWSWLRR
jgi:hypothetical protein